jgi:hypothetical protein
VQRYKVWQNQPNFSNRSDACCLIPHPAGSAPVAARDAPAIFEFVYANSKLPANTYLAYPPKPRPGPGVPIPLSPTQLPPGQTLGYKKISHSFQLIAKNLHPR